MSESLHAPDRPRDRPGDEPGVRVEVVIVTFRRADRLRLALDSLVEAARYAGADLQVGVTVVDDDPDGSAAAVASAYDDEFEAGTTYVVSGSRNISIARNTGLESAVPRADWIASIDDDVLVPRDWFTVCHRAVDDGRFNAVTGPLLKDFAAGPRWLSDEPFAQIGLMVGDDGEPASVCATGNNWMSCAALREWPDLRFDPDLGVTGGEDMDFFHRAVGRGLRPVYSLGAAVSEPEPPSRCTLRYQLRRSFWLGISEAQVSARRRLASRPRLIARGARRALERGERQLPPHRRGDRGWRFTVAVWSNCAGLALGCLGLRMRHR